jgi:hypothetical protein
MELVHSCDECMALLQETNCRHDSFAWAVLCTCPDCDKRFYCCDGTCGVRQARHPFTTRLQLARHNKRGHIGDRDKRRRVDAGQDLCLAPDDNPTTWESTVDNSLCLHAIPTDMFGMLAPHPPTMQFFSDLQNHSFRVAVQGLVARSCYQ